MSSANIIFHVFAPVFHMSNANQRDYFGDFSPADYHIHWDACNMLFRFNNNNSCFTRVYSVHCTQWNANEIYFVMLLLLGWWRKRHHNYTHVPLYLICQLFHFQGCVYTCSYLNVLGSILQSLTHFWIAVRVHVVAALQVNNTLSDKSVFWAYEPAII